ncbi:MAG: glycosyltransferase [Caldilineaceae bacterium]|nr:glycosyltransferase [Caldilineaceae bacterium]
MAKRKPKKPDMPAVVLCSLWRNDEKRRLVDRVEHLLAKSETYPNLRWVWCVGDSKDDTAKALEELSTGYDVSIIHHDTGIRGEAMSTRTRRLSEAANAMLGGVKETDDYVLVHESDLVSPGDVVKRMVAHAQAGRCPIAGWTTLEVRPGQTVFYDTWGTRKDGVRFTNHAPYHVAYTADAPFTVDSFGSVFMFEAKDVEHINMTTGGVLDLCKQLKEQGRELWIDPRLPIVQPVDLWTFYDAP